MKEVSKLLQLQMIDLDLDDKRRQLQLLEARTGEPSALRAARHEFASTADRRKSLELTLRRLESDIEICNAKIGDLEKRLFGGAVGKQKEAGAVEAQIKSLKESRGKTEDSLLEAMSELEDIPLRLSESTSEVERQEASWKAEQEGIHRDIAALRQAVCDLQKARQQAIDVLAADLLAVYEDLRKRHHGRAVAKVERSTCMGCRVALPMGEVQRARTSRELVFCSFCGRILAVEQ